MDAVDLINYRRVYVLTFLVNFLLRILAEDGVGDDDNLQKSIEVPNNLKNHGMSFLMKYGYLPTKDLETGELRSGKELERAIITFQEYSNLKQTGFFDLETIAQMQKSRCGMPDILESTRKIRHRKRHTRRGKRYAVSEAKWPNKDLLYSIINHSPDLSFLQIQAAFREAFKIWSDVTPLTFTEVTSNQKANIHIQFAKSYHDDGYPFDGPGRVLAHAFIPGDRRGGDTHFDDDETWTITSYENGVNLILVAAHEFGHALGLSHSSSVGSMMYPWYQGWDKKHRLHFDDINGIQSLYGDTVNYGPLGPVHTSPDKSGDVQRVLTIPLMTSTMITPYLFPADEGVIDHCKQPFDAISVIRGELFIFTGKWFSRLDKNLTVMKGYPMKISHFWYGISQDITHIDAVYERLRDGKIVFFKGNKYWEFDGNHLAADFPPEGRPVTELGLPHNIGRVDAAFVWGHNGKTYYMSGDMYWRFNEENYQIDYDYPRDIKMWDGCPVPVGAAFQFWDRKTYFFKDGLYYKFNDAKMKVHDGYPRRSNSNWFSCPAEITKNSSDRNYVPLHYLLFTVAVFKVKVLFLRTRHH